MINAAESHRRENKPRSRTFAGCGHLQELVAPIVRLRLGCALLGLFRHCLSSGKLDRRQYRAADLHGFRSLLGGRDANIAREPCCVVRLWRVHEGPGGVVPARGCFLPELAVLSADVLADAGASGAAAVSLCVYHLGCGDIAGLRRRRLSHRAAPSGDRVGAGRTLYRVEFHRRAERISDGIAAGRFAALPRSPAGDGRRVYRLSYLQAAIRHLVPGRSHRIAPMARHRQRRGYGGVVGRWLGHPVRRRAVGWLSPRACRTGRTEPPGRSG